MQTTRIYLLPGVMFAWALLVPTTAVLAAETNHWSFDVSLYGVAAGMSGDMTVKGIPADVDVGFDKILKNLKFGAMGTVRLGYDRWSLSTDVIYMDLEASKGTARASAQQWLVQPMLGYRLCSYFELTAGTRYNSLSATCSLERVIEFSDLRSLVAIEVERCTFKLEKRSTWSCFALIA